MASARVAWLLPAVVLFALASAAPGVPQLALASCQHVRLDTKLTMTSSGMASDPSRELRKVPNKSFYLKLFVT